METYSIVTPDTAQQAQSVTIAASKAVHTVTNVPEHRAAQEYLTDLARIERSVKEVFAEPKSAAHAAHKSICAAESKLLDPILDARKKVTRAIGVYEDEQYKIAEAERRRLESEARAKEEARLLAEAEAAQESGDTQLADQIIEEAIYTPTPVVHVQPQLASTAGVSSQRRWSAEVDDVAALIKYVAANPQFQNLLTPNMPAINAMARSLKENMRIPGVRAFSTAVSAVRREQPV